MGTEFSQQLADGLAKDTPFVTRDDNSSVALICPCTKQSKSRMRINGKELILDSDKNTAKQEVMDILKHLQESKQTSIHVCASDGAQGAAYLARFIKRDSNETIDAFLVKSCQFCDLSTDGVLETQKQMPAVSGNDLWKCQWQ
jgi:hypothetical protein